MVGEDLQDAIRDVRIEIDNYNETVQALKALSHEFRWDDERRVLLNDVFTHIGRRMETSSENRVCPGGEVTPDLVLQRGEEYGLIAEAKLAMCVSPEGRERRIRQVVKYDDDLIGWHTEDEILPDHDILLVVHLFRGQEIHDQLTELQQAGDLEISRPFGLVSFGVVNRTGSEYMTLQLLKGHISLPGKERKLRAVLPIPLDHVAGNAELANMKLYDVEPPLPLLMDLIHHIVFESLSTDEFIELDEENEVRKTIEIRQLRQDLSDVFGPGGDSYRMPEVPRADWVGEAMCLFERMGWAEQIEEAPDRYVYVVKRRRTPFQQFVKRFAEERLQEEESAGRRAAQLTLFQPD